MTSAFGVHEKLAELILGRAGVPVANPLSAGEATRAGTRRKSTTACGDACRCHPVVAPSRRERACHPAAAKRSLSSRSGEALAVIPQRRSLGIPHERIYLHLLVAGHLDTKADPDIRFAHAG